MIVSRARHGARHQRGVTLVELIISIVIIAIAMTAVLNAFSLSVSKSADPLWRNKSLKLAQLYLDEILAKNYDHATPLGGTPPVSSPACGSLGSETGETRATYNDVDDYNGISDNPPVSLIGALDATYAPYTVAVTVTCDGSRVGASGNNHAKKIMVTISPPAQAPVVFSAYKGNY
ncbi:MAG: MSHA biogenesis protein MshD [Oleiphilus sp.]|nr:MAG: MSHA biogenesis protein MshD [Oleiphilus sp.]